MLKLESIFCVRFEVFMVLSMKAAVFWDIKFNSVPHRKHITCPPQSLVD
jgi:hypothetical protein